MAMMLASAMIGLLLGELLLDLQQGVLDRFAVVEVVHHAQA
jgi:hypothetical protein